MKEDDMYQGVGIKLNAFLASARIPIQVDIGFGDAITPDPIEIGYPESFGAQLAKRLKIAGLTPNESRDFSGVQKPSMLGLPDRII